MSKKPKSMGEVESKLVVLRLLSTQVREELGKLTKQWQEVLDIPSEDIAASCEAELVEALVNELDVLKKELAIARATVNRNVGGSFPDASEDVRWILTEDIVRSEVQEITKDGVTIKMDDKVFLVPSLRIKSKKLS